MSSASARRRMGRVAAVLLDVMADQRLEQGAGIRLQGPALLEEVGQRPVLFEKPGVHRGDQAVAGDEVHLEGQDAEEQVAIRGGLGHGDGSLLESDGIDRIRDRNAGRRGRQSLT